MGDVGDYWRETRGGRKRAPKEDDAIPWDPSDDGEHLYGRSGSQARRARNRESSQEVLRRHEVSFETKNDGAHLIVRGERVVVDFWPGTGLWIVRGTGERKRGVFPLLRRLGVRRQE